MNNNKFFLSEKSTIRDAINKINENASQIALVIKKKKIIGLVTDGDIRRAILNKNSLETRVVSIMKKNFKYSIEGTSDDDALNYMKKENLRHLPILDKNKNFIKLLLFDQLIANNKLQNHVIIMAGGKGKRLGKMTKTIPKPLVKINEKPILEIILEKTTESGFSNFHFSVNYLKDKIKNYFKDGSKWKVDISYIEEKTYLGTIGSISLLNYKNFKNSLIVMNGDVLTKVNFNSMLKFHNESNADITICTTEMKTHIPYGVVNILNTRVKSIEEKPIIENFINAGVYIIEPHVIGLVKKILKKDKFCDMTTLLNSAILNQYKVIAFPVHEYWNDIGNPNSLTKSIRDWY